MNAKLKLSLFVKFLVIVLLAAGCFGMAKYFRDTPAGTAVNEPNAQQHQRCPEKNAVELICNGRFEEARKLLTSVAEQNEKTEKLKEIINQYQAIESKRAEKKQQVLQEKIEEFEKLKAQAEVNEPNILDILAAVIKIRNYADKADKDKILQDVFAAEAIEKAKLLGEKYEQQGKWLDALLYCYSWLDNIYSDDEMLSEKRQQLEQRALIKMQLQDNPCETVADRYKNIKPEMFEKSLEVLEFAYVEPFDYTEMTDNVFERMENLAYVLKFINTADANSDANSIVEFEQSKLPEFAAGITGLKTEYTNKALVISRDQFIKLFKAVIALNESTIALDGGIVISHYAQSALTALDPHTMLVWPKEVEDFEKNMTNEFTGVGIEISKRDGLLTAVSLIPDAPAYSSGIDAGDIIEKVDGEATRDMTVNCAVSKITGKAGTKVVLTIRKPDAEETNEITIVRDKIIVPTTRGWCRNALGQWLYFVDTESKIGYVRMSNFSAATAKDLDQELTKLEQAGMKAFILDLRYNTGGFLQSAGDVADLFVDKGIIVSTQPRVGMPSWHAAHRKGTHPNYPLVILINGGSASASEIVSGALADETYKRATLVGQQSYGKGSVQTVTGYPGGGAQLKYTMAYYHLPNGKKVKSRYAVEKLGEKDWGVMPDVKVELRDDEIKNIFDIQRDNDILAAENHDNEKDKLVRHNLQEIIDADAQLATAVLVAKAKIVERN